MINNIVKKTQNKLDTIEILKVNGVDQTDRVQLQMNLAIISLQLEENLPIKFLP